VRFDGLHQELDPFFYRHLDFVWFDSGIANAGR
jgi:hypothetical protein